MERTQRTNTKWWMGINLGCCTSDQEMDERDSPVRAHGLCHQQPQPVLQPRAELLPSTSPSVSHRVTPWNLHSCDSATRTTSCASNPKLTRQWQSQFRSSINHPAEFRHVDGSQGIQIQSMLTEASMPAPPCRSFRPLELSIYLPDGCGRLSPLPNFRGEECWSNSPTELGIPAEARVRGRDSRTLSLCLGDSISPSLQRRTATPLPRRSSIQSLNIPTTHERQLSGTTVASMATPTRPLPLENPRSMPGSMDGKYKIQRPRTSGSLSPGHLISRLPSPSRNRANTTPSSLRRAQTEVDDAIRELNTIVEERRANAYRSHAQAPALINRPPPSPSHHVPYIAPSMRMRVRSETLSDIGSAFSAPLSRPVPGPRFSTGVLPTTRPSNLKLSPGTYSSTDPFTPANSAPHTTPLRRLSAWLRRSASAIALATRLTTPKGATSPYRYETPSSLTSIESRTILHTRHISHDSNATATITLVSSSSSSSSSSSTRSTLSSPPPRKLRRIPEPLTLVKAKEIAIEATLSRAATPHSTNRPVTPLGALHDPIVGMAMSAKEIEGMAGSVGVSSGGMLPVVGVAF